MITAKEYNPIIAGIDPGTTTGIALLNLDGNVILTRRGKNFSKKDIIKLISDYGTPIVIAGDVCPASKSIEKIASSFSSKLITPDYSLSRRDKMKSTKPFLIGRHYSRHERDALAAAIFGWKKIKHTIFKVDRKLRILNEYEIGLSNFVKRNVIMNRESIDSSIKLFKELNIS